MDSDPRQGQEAAGAGYDRVRSSVGFTLGANIEELNLTGAKAINGTGNDLANTIVGNAGANALSGGAGDDLLNGGAGNDRMSGGAGNDVYVVDSAGDQTVELAANGRDRVRASISYTLAADVENLVLAGNSSASTGRATCWAIRSRATQEAIPCRAGPATTRLLGGGATTPYLASSGRDRLDGGSRSNTLVGRSGDDVYITDDDLHFNDGYSDTIIEHAGEGTDRHSPRIPTP